MKHTHLRSRGDLSKNQFGAEIGFDVGDALLNLLVLHVGVTGIGLMEIHGEETTATTRAVARLSKYNGQSRAPCLVSLTSNEHKCSTLGLIRKRTGGTPSSIIGTMPARATTSAMRSGLDFQNRDRSIGVEIANLERLPGRENS